MELIKNLTGFRQNYLEIKNTLPWLDSCVWEDETPAFKGYAKAVETDYIKSMELHPSLKGRLADLKEKGFFTLRFTPDNGPLGSFREVFREMAENKIPLSVLHTDVDFDRLTAFADKNEGLNIIIESGPRKILYFIDKIKEVLAKNRNIYLSTYNLCNWLGHEQLCRMGFQGRLLYGSHMPAFSCDVSMGPVVLSSLDWETKCDIAGNNLRKLLGIEPVYPSEVKYLLPYPFIVDTHSHNIQPGNRQYSRFFTPDLEFTPSDWIGFMDLYGIDRLYLIPVEALYDSKITCRENVQELIKYRPNRFFYLEVFNPGGDSNHIKNLEISLNDPKCLGIKIHPVEHRTNADDDKYVPVYKLANKYKKPVMSHSWEISGYNPEQYRSHPDRFIKHLKSFTEVPFIFGHAGGRPSTIDSVERICNEFSNVFVDIAGDYYNNGLIGALTDRIGVGKVLYASDVNWMDPRCNMAPVLGSDLKADDLLKILRMNALKVFNKT